MPFAFGAYLESANLRLMNVLCISTPKKGQKDISCKVSIGGVYKVISSGDSIGPFSAYYEFEHDPGICYAQKLFVPIDPTEEDIREFEEREKKEEELV